MKCKLCNGEDQKLIFNLGKSPLGIPILNNSKKNIFVESLKIYVCKNCYLIQNFTSFPKEVKIDTQYTTKSELIKKHHKKLAGIIKSLEFKTKNPLVMEIGCSDGGLLNMLKKVKFNNLIGIEPAIHKDIDYDFPIIQKFFNKELVDNLSKDNCRPELLITSYIIENISELEEFFKNVQKLLKINSWFVIEVPYSIDHLKNLRIDAFSHLNRYWFTITSLDYILTKIGVKIFSISHDDEYRGGTLTIVGKKQQTVTLNHNLKQKVVEEKDFLESINNNEMHKRIEAIRIETIDHIKLLKSKKIDVIGFGGGIKSSTLLNWLGLSKNEMKFVVDSDSSKQDKIIPLTGIQIKSIDEILNLNVKIAVVVLALDFADEVIPLLLNKLPPNSEIITILPKFVITKT